jgi:hypothetical protein
MLLSEIFLKKINSQKKHISQKKIFLRVLEKINSQKKYKFSEKNNFSEKYGQMFSVSM